MHIGVLLHVCMYPQTIGVITKVSQALLGLTLLAWANSLGDMVANTCMARAGCPEMSIAACLASPLLNMLVGIGVSMLWVCSTQTNPYPLTINLEIAVCAGFLIVGLLSHLIIIPMTNFVITKKHGIGLIMYYSVFLTLALLHQFMPSWFAWTGSHSNDK